MKYKKKKIIYKYKSKKKKNLIQNDGKIISEDDKEMIKLFVKKDH